MLPVMKRNAIIASIPELITAFGGPTRLAEMLNVTQGYVSKWIMQDRIPEGWHLRLERMCEARGMLVHDRVWGLEGFDPHAPMAFQESQHSAAE